MKRSSRELHCRELGALTLLLPCLRLPWAGREQAGAGGVNPGATRCRFSQPGGGDPHSRGDVKHVYAAGSAGTGLQEWRHRRLGREEGGKGQFTPRPPAAPSTELTLNRKALGMLRNLIVRQL